MILDKNVNAEGRKFYFMKNGVLKTFWFVLIATFLVEFVRQIFLIFGKQVIDTTLMWGFTKLFAGMAVGGFLAYAGVNVWQHIKTNNSVNNKPQ